MLENLAGDKAFLETLVQRIAVRNLSVFAVDTLASGLTTRQKPTEPNAESLAMLLANIAKSQHATTLLTLTLKPVPNLSTSPLAVTQLLDVFVKGAEGLYNNHANFDHLSYVFADLGAHASGRAYLTTAEAHDNDVVPLAKLAVFSEHARAVRRRGAAAALKNAAFDTAAHAALLDPHGPVNVLPYVLAPLMGGEDYGADGEGLPDEVQLLPPDKQREADVDIIKTHLETLLLFSSTRHGREVLRAKSVYAVVREVHLQVEDEDVREVCDRIVQVLMRGEPEDEGEGQQERIEEVDSDEEIVDVL